MFVLLIVANLVIPTSTSVVWVYWQQLRHISQFKRVDLETLFHPDGFGTEILGVTPRRE
jgi:hypothetical protein